MTEIKTTVGKYSFVGQVRVDGAVKTTLIQDFGDNQAECVAYQKAMGNTGIFEFAEGVAEDGASPKK